MLVEFKVANFRSIKDEVNLSLMASQFKDLRQNIIETSSFDLLKSVVVYGANASGKSNLMNAIVFMRWFIINSSKETQVSEKIKYRPFRLSSETINADTKFEIIFLIKDVLFRYGFMFNAEVVTSEWLFETTKQKENLLFRRNKDGFEISNKFDEGNGLQEKTRNNVLFLSVVSQFNGAKSKEIVSWFQSVKTVLGLIDTRYRKETIDLLNDKLYRKIVLEFIKNADLGIVNLKEEIQDVPQLDENKLGEVLSKEYMKNISESLQDKKYSRVVTVHSIYDAEKKIIGEVDFDLNRDESEGTKKYFNIVGAIIEALLSGKLVIIDELDARLHPILVNSIISLFNSKEANKNNAQLVFTSHGTHILNPELMRRDQVYFTEKNKIEATELYPLTRYKPRNDVSIEKNYIAGRYGAVPFIGDLEKVFCDVADTGK